MFFAIAGPFRAGPRAAQPPPSRPAGHESFTVCSPSSVPRPEVGHIHGFGSPSNSARREPGCEAKEMSPLARDWPLSTFSESFGGLLANWSGAPSKNAEEERRSL